MADAAPQIKAIRKIRHWKQRYDPKARFCFRRPTTIPKPPKSGKAKPKPVEFVAGELIPEWVLQVLGPAKLRRWWESHRIELYDFGDPNVVTGRVDVADPTGQRQGTGKPAKRKAPAKKAASAKTKSAKKAAAKKKAASAKSKKKAARKEAAARKASEKAEKKAQADAAAAADAQGGQGGDPTVGGESQQPATSSQSSSSSAQTSTGDE